MSDVPVGWLVFSIALFVGVFVWSLRGRGKTRPGPPDKAAPGPDKDK